MEKLLRCRDLGPDCEFEACADTTEDALQISIDHARAVHGLKEISEKDQRRARAAIQDSFCVPMGGYKLF